MDENVLINNAEKYLNKISEEEINLEDMSKLDSFLPIYFKFQERLETLQQIKETMDAQGYTSPYRALSKYGITAVRNTPIEEVGETNRHNQYFRMKASAKKNILDRVKSSIDAHKIAIGHMDEYGKIECEKCHKKFSPNNLKKECSCSSKNYKLLNNESANHRLEILPYLPYGGNYMVLISQLSRWGRDSFKKVLNILKQERKGSVKTVSLLIRYKEGNRFIRKRVTLDSYYVDSYEEEIRKRYGKNVRIEALQFHRTKPAIIDDKNTRNALAIGYVRLAEDIVKKHKNEILKDNIRNFEKLSHYDEIVYEMKQEKPKFLDISESLEDWREEKTKKELTKVKLMYKNGNLNRQLSHDLKTREIITKTIFTNIAPCLILWDMFKYYLTTSNDKRKRHGGPFPYIREEIDRQQRDVFQKTYTKTIKILQERESEKIIPISEMDLILHKKFKLEKQIKHSNMKINNTALGGAMIYNEGKVPIENIAQVLSIEPTDITNEKDNIEKIAKPKSQKSKQFLELLKK